MRSIQIPRRLVQRIHEGTPLLFGGELVNGYIVSLRIARPRKATGKHSYQSEEER